MSEGLWRAIGRILKWTALAGLAGLVVFVVEPDFDPFAPHHTNDLDAAGPEWFPRALDILNGTRGGMKFDCGHQIDGLYADVVKGKSRKFTCRVHAPPWLVVYDDFDARGCPFAGLIQRHPRYFLFGVIPLREHVLVHEPVHGYVAIDVADGDSVCPPEMRLGEASRR